MSELSTLARPYAEAVFSLAREQGNLDAWAAAVDFLAGVGASAELQAIAGDPRVSHQQLAGLVRGALPVTPPAGFDALLEALIENRRLPVLHSLAQQFRTLKNRFQGTADALVESAFPLDDAALAALKASLERRFALRLNITVVVDPALIGGVRVTVGDKVLDTSVKARLQGMQSHLLANV